MAALFRKKNETTIAELEEYYANQQRGRSAKAWFMAFLSLLITVAVIVGLFYAGKWLYQTITDSDSDETTTTETTTSDSDGTSVPTFDSDNAGEVGVGFEEGSSNNPDDLIVVDNSQPTQDYPSVVDDGAAVTTDSNADRVASNDNQTTTDTAQNGQNSSSNTNTSDSQSAVGGATTANNESGKEVPNTGPGETALVIVIATGIAGYVASRKYYTSK